MRKVKLLSDAYLPPTKFNKGDIIKIPNKYNKKYVYISISKIIYSGTTTHCEQCGKTFTAIKEYRYEGTIQPDSFSDGVDLLPLRPGKAILFQKDDIECYQLLNHYPHKPVDEDNVLNIKQREKDWRTYLSQYQQGN